MSARTGGSGSALITGIKLASVSLAGTAIVVMAAIMLAEAIMRYVFSEPLGWNISAVERILMPISVFLALPWLYVTAGHVSAEIVYDRFPSSWRKAARIIGHLLLLTIAAAMAWGGMVTVIDSFVLSDAPPPGSSEVPIPSWIWQLSQPVGAAALFLVALLDSRRAVIEDRALEDTEGNEAALIAAATEDSDDGGGQA
ncbi:TRAP transporter small permease [Brevibacterium sp. GP-SGM9]|uniref:TRAP transporter small permease n=1 Tax=unclassified Brevibacterium TaxID=2614124 RepID=UPI001E487CC6|nr:MULTISPECIES: TRAP transporter small permease [unclassified Brevibacterium]MCD1285419.1 TRAP transporter small permease [Brevibacterium sp. CCUG 69071]MDK8434469.1 TRAP transporter small permease [Brevibacterium sp. H-BE7]